MHAAAQNKGAVYECHTGPSAGISLKATWKWQKLRTSLRIRFLDVLIYILLMGRTWNAYKLQHIFVQKNLTILY